MTVLANGQPLATELSSLAASVSDRAALASYIADRLEGDLAALRMRWLNPSGGTATRHVAIDGLVPPAIALDISRAFPRDGAGFQVRKSFREQKRTSAELDRHPPLLADISHALQSPRVLAMVESITGIAGLEPDPSLYAGGLSMMFRGDFLNPHIDNSHDGARGKYRRINLLYYASPDWQAEHGGNLELWDDAVTRPATILSVFNRLVLMETNRASWHSVSPVTAPGPRCCVSSYYFSQISPDGSDYCHVTSFTGRPGQPFRRALGSVDNAARGLVQSIGVRRATDRGDTGKPRARR